jgi:hypothetical protein
LAEQLADTGSAAAPAAVAMAGAHAPPAPALLQFTAIFGLQEQALPASAAHRIEGSVNLMTGSGMVTSRVLAGHLGGSSESGLPVLSCVIRVTSVDCLAGRLRIHGVIEEPSQLRPGEKPRVDMVLDPARGVLWAPFVSRDVELTLV